MAEKRGGVLWLSKKAKGESVKFLFQAGVCKKMKHYEKVEITVLFIQDSDIVRTSPGVDVQDSSNGWW